MAYKKSALGPNLLEHSAEPCVEIPRALNSTVENVFCALDPITRTVPITRITVNMTAYSTASCPRVSRMSEHSFHRPSEVDNYSSRPVSTSFAHGSAITDLTFSPNESVVWDVTGEFATISASFPVTDAAPGTLGPKSVSEYHSLR